MYMYNIFTRLLFMDLIWTWSSTPQVEQKHFSFTLECQREAVQNQVQFLINIDMVLQWSWDLNFIKNKYKTNKNQTEYGPKYALYLSIFGSPFEVENSPRKDNVASQTAPKPLR